MSQEATQSAKNQDSQPMPVVSIYGTKQKITVGASSLQSNAFASNVSMIFITTSTSCWVNTGTNPTVSASGANLGTYLPANSGVYLLVSPGDKIAVIQNGSSSGFISLTEIA